MSDLSDQIIERTVLRFTRKVPFEQVEELSRDMMAGVPHDFGDVVAYIEKINVGPNIDRGDNPFNEVTVTAVVKQ